MTAEATQRIATASRDLPDELDTQVINYIFTLKSRAGEDIYSEEQKVLDDFLELYGSVEVPNDFDEETDKERYLKESYESLA